MRSFLLSCDNGHLDVMKWLTDTFSITREDAIKDKNLAFRWAAESGHLHVLKWLKKTFSLTKEDILSEYNCAFRRAAENGHLHVLQWLTEEFSLTSKDISRIQNYAYAYAKKNEHHNVCNWLLSTFELNLPKSQTPSCANCKGQLFGRATNCRACSEKAGGKLLCHTCSMFKKCDMCILTCMNNDCGP